MRGPSSTTAADTLRSAEGRLGTSPLGTELLDDPGADPATVRASLRHIARANRWFGGRAAVLWGLRRALRGTAPGSRVSLLDIGTGAGDLPRAAERWARRRGFHLEVFGLERSAAAAALARAHGVPAIVADAGAIPVRPGSVDVVLLSQVAHHFAPASAETLFRSCHRIARRALVVADLRRSRAAAAAFSVGSRLLRFDPVTRADGHTSIRRGYSAAELAALLPPEAEIARRPGWRLVAVWPAG
ncbi:MAG TPA: methyltransferase domain-containing protein [Gemmatimonadales bacterium]|nr:methyltransferase domain-containing protein [Gemmatimonadales bacterium]